MTQPIPMVLRSRRALAGGGAPVATLPLLEAGTTYTMAQEATFVGPDHYAVGRWDGSLSVFAFTPSTTVGPTIAVAVNSPAEEGVQMITALDGATAFVTSNDDASAVVWISGSGAWTDLVAAATLAFPASCGVANSGAVTTVAGLLYLAIGHANGWVTVWLSGASLADWSLVATTDVRSGHPVNPWGMANIRGVAALPSDAAAGYVVTGSEDGNLTVVRVPDGAILNAIVYNPLAQRGINSVAAEEFNLLVANCAVGPTDFNLWSYSVTPGTWAITLADHANLAVDPTAAQVFNFDVVWAPLAPSPSNFFCSTEEGVVWMGELGSGGLLDVVGYQAIGGGALGSAICCQGELLAATAHDLHEFLIERPSAPPA